MLTPDGLEHVRDAHAELLRRFDEYRDVADDSVRQNIVDEAREAIELHLRTAEAVLLPLADRTLDGTDDEAVSSRAELEHELLRLVMDRLGSLYSTEATFRELVMALEGHLQAYVEFMEDRLVAGLEGRINVEQLASSWKMQFEEVRRAALGEG